MLEENVVRAAGTRYDMSIRKMVNLIQGAGRDAAQRDTTYRIIKRYDN
jgi:cyclic dehypoxanthinyl futalosine synthase